jgi:hypothetical protein
MKRPFVLWTSCFGLLISVAVAANQQDPAAVSSPLEVQTSTVSAGQGFNLTCRVTNKSNQDIVAYTIVVDFLESSGKPAGRLSTNAIMNLATNSNGSTRGLSPGATGGSNRPFSLPSEPNGTPVRFRVFVDYVLFKDGSTWGPDVMKQSLKIVGTQDGWRMSRAELKRLLAEPRHSGRCRRACELKGVA